MPEKEEHRPTLRVLNLLQAVASHAQGLTLTEISELAGSPKSSLFPIVHTLVEEGYLVLRPNSSRYTLGIKMFELGQCFLEQVDLFTEIKTEMHHIVNVCSETCHFGILEGSDVLYLHKDDSLEPIRMFSSVGKRLPAYGTGLGKALLSDCDADDLRRLYPNGLKPLTEHTITDLQVLAAQMEQIRASGVAYEKEESNLLIQCVAVPVKKSGRIVAALSIAVPVFRATDEKMELCKGLVINARKKIERLLESMEINFYQFL